MGRFTVAAYSWETLKEVSQGFVAFTVLEERLDCVDGRKSAFSRYGWSFENFAFGNALPEQIIHSTYYPNGLHHLLLLHLPRSRVTRQNLKQPL